MKDQTPFVLGLTGSIGMGKSTTAQVFRDAGVPVWDADAAVHKLYSQGGAAVHGIAAICPEAVIDGHVSREVLRGWISHETTALSQLNAVVHPLVAQDRLEFIREAASKGQNLVVVDVPLLFETGGDSRVDATLVVTIGPDIQKARVMQRDAMTKAHFHRILSTQMHDTEKRQRADYVIKTVSLESVTKDVANLLQDLQQRISNNA